jgi:hypothetical protein
MVHASSPAMFPNIGSPYGQPLSAVGSPEDIKPNVGYAGATSPPARRAGSYLPWMTDGQSQPASTPVSAAPSPRTQFDLKREPDDGMDVDVNLNSEASDSGSEHQGGEEKTQEQPELTLEEKLQQRFPSFEKHRPLRFTDLQAIELRESKKRRLQDHVGELLPGWSSAQSDALTSSFFFFQSPPSNRNIHCILRRRTSCVHGQQSKAYITAAFKHGQHHCPKELDNARMFWLRTIGCIAWSKR